MKGLIHIYEGDGKGKTTCAVGLAVRCAGNNQKVLFTQFLKDGTSKELNILKEIKQIEVFSATKNFGFTFQMTKEQKEQAAAYYQSYFKNIIKKIGELNYDMLVMDEFMAAYQAEFVDHTIALEFLKNKPEQLEVVLTGRNPSEELIQLADYHSKIKKIKHPYDLGIPARDGIER